MYCPQCGAEYRPGFTRCADCEVPLVAAKPPAPEPLALTTVFSTGAVTSPITRMTLPGTSSSRYLS